MSKLLHDNPRAPKDIKSYIQEVGKYLIQKNGKKKFYKPEEVILASKNTSYDNSKDLNTHSWAMCIFVSHEDFDNYHQDKKATFKYKEMRKQMLLDLTTGSSNKSTDWNIIPEIVLDLSWLEFGDVFGNIFEGIGGIIGGIFDASS